MSRPCEQILQRPDCQWGGDAQKAPMVLPEGTPHVVLARQCSGLYRNRRNDAACIYSTVDRYIVNPLCLPKSRHRLKKLLSCLCALVLLKGIWIALMREDGGSLLRGESRADVMARRAYLIEHAYERGESTEDMPGYLSAQFKGEWALVTYSMLTTALTNIAFAYPETQSEARLVIRTLIQRTLRPEIREFDLQRWGEDPIESLQGSHGHIGYLGHLNWMLGAYKLVGGEEEFDTLFHGISRALAQRLRSSPGSCLHTYPQEAIYTPDNVVVIASLANYGRIFGNELQEIVNRWVQDAQDRMLDPELKLLAFHLDEECRAIGGVRGSGAGWNSFYLPFIDAEFAGRQYQGLLSHLKQTRLLTGIREYPRGVFGLGDVDSGPVVFGFSPSGTGL